MTWTLLAVIGLIVSTPSAGIQQPTSSPSLDFEFFKTRVQPMDDVAKRAETDDEDVHPRIRARRSRVEWSLGSPTIAMRPP